MFSLQMFRRCLRPTIMIQLERWWSSGICNRPSPLLLNSSSQFHHYHLKNSTFESKNRFDDRPKLQWRWDLITTILVILGVIDAGPQDSPLIMTIKRGILAKQRRQYHQAEMILHTALKMAQDLAYTDAETYIFDVMADNYLEKGDHQKAMDLYMEVLSRLSQKEDFRLDGEPLVEISIKLAYCYGQIGETKNAETGFQWVIDTQLIRTDPFWDDRKSQWRSDDPISNEEMETRKNSLAILGMAYDYYSKHLEQLSMLDHAVRYRLKALKISLAINGEHHEQTLVLENDIADLYARQEKYDLAKNYLRRVIGKAREIESIELPVYYLNMASILFQENRLDQGKSYCRQTFDIVSGTDKKLKLLQERLQYDLPERERRELLRKSELCLNGMKFY